MFTQRDILMQQIEAIGAWLAQQFTDAADLTKLDDEAECEAAAGLSLDVAERLPISAVQSLVDDPARLAVLGLGLARRAQYASGLRQFTLAKQAASLWKLGIKDRPDLYNPAVEEALERLRS